MAVDVTTSIEIACPRPVVAEYVSNPDNATRWYVNIKSISWQTPPPAVVGSRIGGTDDVFLDAPGEPEDLERLKAILEDRQLSRTLG